LAWSQSVGAPPDALAKLSTEIGRIERDLGKLTGAFEVSQSQIFASPKFKQALKVTFDAIGDDLATLTRVREALERFAKEGDALG
jgi:hypothetical protein